MDKFVKAPICVFWDCETALISLDWDNPCSVFVKVMDAIRVANMQGFIEIELYMKRDNWPFSYSLLFGRANLRSKMTIRKNGITPQIDLILDVYLNKIIIFIFFIFSC
jgi:hypothetical protein